MPPRPRNAGPKLAGLGFEPTGPARGPTVFQTKAPDFCDPAEMLQKTSQQAFVVLKRLTAAGRDLPTFAVDSGTTVVRNADSGLGA